MQIDAIEDSNIFNRDKAYPNIQPFPNTYKEKTILRKETKESILKDPKSLARFTYLYRTGYRRLTWRIWVFLKANPDILQANNNQEILEHLAEIQAKLYVMREPDWTLENARASLELVSDLYASNNNGKYHFDQEILELFRPGAEHDQASSKRLLCEVLKYMS